MRNLNSPTTQVLSILMLVILLFSSSTLSAANDWRLEKDEENIKVYLRDTAGSAVKSFMGKTRVKTSLSALLSVLNDSINYPRWLFNTRSAKTISRKGDDLLTNYVVTNMPWPVADRDAVIVSKRTQNPSNKRVEIKLSNNPTQVPKVKGKVRIENLKGRWLFTPINKNEVDIVYEMSIDPGGNIPKWVVNSMTVDLPFNTLKNLKRISREPKYANAKVKGIID